MSKAVLTKPIIFFTEFLILVGLFSASLLLQQLPARGYGYGACSMTGPTDLMAMAVLQQKSILLSWQQPATEECDQTAIDHYVVQMRYNDGTLIQTFESVGKESKLIGLHNLRRNHSYKFRVRAVTIQGTTTSWSDFKLFRTIPKPPTQLTIDMSTPRRPYVSWQNVTRSSRLQYYQVIVVQKNTQKIVFRKKVRLGLHRVRTGTMLSNLRSNTFYAVKVRSVANSTTYSAFQSKNFIVKPPE